MATKEDMLDAIRAAAKALGEPLSLPSFMKHAKISGRQVFNYFPTWGDAANAAGIQYHAEKTGYTDAALLQDWGEVVRKLREIPTVNQYRIQGRFSKNTFAKHFGPWSSVPQHFRKFAGDKPEWAHVLALLPVPPPKPITEPETDAQEEPAQSMPRPPVLHHEKLQASPTYGNPIDFRGLRHEPINENGVIFLFGMVAKELGYHVEAVQAGFPDCEAKRQIAPGKWQRARIEFEYESRNFKEHGHSADKCDVLVCWRHNWPECPKSIEVVPLKRVIQQLAKSDD